MSRARELTARLTSADGHPVLTAADDQQDNCMPGTYVVFRQMPEGGWIEVFRWVREETG